MQRQLELWESNGGEFLQIPLYQELTPDQRLQIIRQLARLILKQVQNNSKTNGARLSGVIVDLPLINTDEALMENEVGRAVPGEPRSLVAPWFKTTRGSAGRFEVAGPNGASIQV